MASSAAGVEEQLERRDLMLTVGWHTKPSIEDYAERNAQQLEWWKAQNGQLAGTAPSWRARTDLGG